MVWKNRDSWPVRDENLGIRKTLQPVIKEPIDKSIINATENPINSNSSQRTKKENKLSKYY